ncbi:MAG: cyclic-di-AMP receptor [Eubacterium sp.]|nr:cyclic-di-AMP receptor [Eubacterium sp.]
MKLVITIISNSDVDKVLAATARDGYSATKIATTGQFLVDGHTAVFFGCEEDKVEKLYSILKENVKKRTVKKTGVKSTLAGSLLNQEIDVEENGAVAFTLDVEDFRKF